VAKYWGDKSKGSEGWESSDGSGAKLLVGGLWKKFLETGSQESIDLGTHCQRTSR
jgi:hypothetical protein